MYYISYITYNIHIAYIAHFVHVVALFMSFIKCRAAQALLGQSSSDDVELLNQLRTCSVRVAASGVFCLRGFFLIEQLKRCSERSREAKTHVWKFCFKSCVNIFFLQRQVCYVTDTGAIASTRCLSQYFIKIYEVLKFSKIKHLKNMFRTYELPSSVFDISKC